MIVKRLLTAALLIPLAVMATLLLENKLFAIVVMLVVVLSTWEYCQLIQIKQLLFKAFYSLLVGIVGLAVGLYESVLMPVLIVSALWWLVNILWIAYYPRFSRYWYSNRPIRLVNGFLIFVPMLAALAALQRQSSEMVLLLLVLIWSADSGAFFVGKAIGKHKLCANVSPGKTVEGTIGGIVTTIGVMMPYVALQVENAASEQYLIFAILALLVAIASVIGDLFESLFKRISNIKDSGNLLPGHGGIFDRIDSLTAAAPVFYLGYAMLT